MKVLIVGGVAGGASAAARARRLSEEAHIILFERGPDVSFANCGLPYYVGGVIEQRDDLLLQTPASLGRRFALDVRVLTEYLVKTLKLVPPVRKPAPASPEEPAAPAVEAPKEIEEPDEPPPPPPIVQAAEEQVDEEGAELMQRRCSKCHTLVRVFGKLDSYERALFTLQRMRLKTGSGISRDDYERLEAFLKAQFGVQ